MRVARIIGAVALLLAVAPAAALSAQPSSRAPADLTTRVERTTDGGYLMGNPNAPMKLVEYGSIACSHCAEFEAAAGDEIRDHVRSGRVSFEYRPFPIFPSDPGLFLLLGCQAPDKFFTTVHRLYETQNEWVARLDAQEAELNQEVERTSWATALPSFIRVSGTAGLFRENGLTDQQIATCLADRAGLERLAAAARRGQERGVQGTPTFYLNGELLEVTSWAQLLVRLRQP